jgi:hypothetical protein
MDGSAALSTLGSGSSGRAEQVSAMFGTWRPGGLRKAQPVGMANRSRRSAGADVYVRLLAARGLVVLATCFLRVVERAYRAGYLDLAQVEYSVRVSANLRGRACRMIGTRPAKRHLCSS